MGLLLEDPHASEMEQLEMQANQLESELMQVGTQEQEMASWDILRRRPKSSVPEMQGFKKVEHKVQLPTN